MGKPKKQHRKKRFNYDIDRKKVWKKQKKLPEIECKQIKNAWDTRKSLKQNMKDMGLSVDPNETLKIPLTKDTMTKIRSLPEEFTPTKLPEKAKKLNVVEELEAEANVEQASTMRISEPEVRYCIYMIEKHGDDFKAMARDSKNYYQDTPKQIKRKINKFKSVPDQYNAYLRSKETVSDAATSEVPVIPGERTPVRSVLPMTSFTRRATRKYIAKRRNGNYNTTPIEKGHRRRISIKQKTNVPFYHVRRKLHFGRTPPKCRGNTAITSEARAVHISLSKSSPENKIKSSTLQDSQMSREVNSLLQMSSGCVLPNRLRSSPRKYSGHLHGDQQLSDYRLNSSSEHMNLSRIE